MHVALAILETAAEHHIAAALPVNRARLGKGTKPIQESMRAGDAAGVKLGISAG
jgi:hypothetical protein